MQEFGPSPTFAAMASPLHPLPFPSFSSEVWKQRVERELKGKSYDDFLIWNSLDGFNMEAWSNSLPDSLPAVQPLSEPWKIVEPVYEEDARQANRHALEALMAGAEAIWFDKGYLGAAAEVACRNIDREIAPVFIDEGNYVDPYRHLLKTAETDDSPREGAWLINGVRLRERGANLIQEAAVMLAQAIELGDRQGYEVPILFKSGIGNGFLSEIAKLRALRWIWSGVLKQRGLTPANPTLLAVNLSNTYAINDEHSNILRATSSAMSAVIGGAQFIMVEPWNKHWKENDPFSARISRNIQTLLKEEGRMDKNLNPADGSYFIENLTATIAEKVWEQVTEIQRAGGFTAYARSRKLKEALADSRKKSAEAYTSGSNVLLGVNKYPPAEPKQEHNADTTCYALLPDYLFIPAELQNEQV